MSTRRLVYPEYAAQVITGGDILLSFNTPGSKFGPVHVILVADDADALLTALAKALDKSDAYLSREVST